MTLGPSGLNPVGGDTHGDGLQVFTSIALMLVAFGIGERFDLQQLRASAKALAWVSSGEVAGSFVLTGVAVGLTAWLTGMGGEGGGTGMWVATALHTERILVPISGPEDLRIVQPLTCALGAIMEHHITLLRLMPPEMREDELTAASAEVMQWPRVRHIPSQVRCEAVAAESRSHTVLQAAEDHDIIVMATSSQRGLRRAFFGSLAEDVALRSKKTMLLVHGGLEARTLEDIT